MSNKSSGVRSHSHRWVHLYYHNVQSRAIWWLFGWMRVLDDSEICIIVCKCVASIYGMRTCAFHNKLYMFVWSALCWGTAVANIYLLSFLHVVGFIFVDTICDMFWQIQQSRKGLIEKIAMANTILRLPNKLLRLFYIILFEYDQFHFKNWNWDKFPNIIHLIDFNDISFLDTIGCDCELLCSIFPDSFFHKNTEPIIYFSSFVIFKKNRKILIYRLRCLGNHQYFMFIQEICFLC